jgi:hypothetical protein
LPGRADRIREPEPGEPEGDEQDLQHPCGAVYRGAGNLRPHRIRVYGTFIFGYDGDTPESFAPTVAFAREHALYIAAFNHLTPFPGTPLYQRLQDPKTGCSTSLVAR